MSSMAKQKPERANLLQGTLDMLILRTLLYGPAHGHQIGKHIQRTTNDFLQMQHGSLYPALHRLARRGWVSSKWRWLQIGIGNSSTTGLPIREENSSSSKNLDGSRWQKPWRE
jgi:Transcriptional regulator PadR-like family